ncbi:hypothetical protein FRC01_012582 [Tulasnella sp. 417]|nr:hypothetical protein FRC01_012582 [Tulasnella sp. 417]
MENTHNSAVCLVNKGEHSGKLAVIVEIVDHARAILDGPATGVPRGLYHYNNVLLTPLVMKLPRGARSKKVRKEFEAQKIVEKWEASSWAKRRAAKTARQNLSDFGRFEVMVHQKRRRNVVRKAVSKAKAA